MGNTCTHGVLWDGEDWLKKFRTMKRNITCSCLEVEGSHTIGRIRNISLDFRVFLTISWKMWYQYHMCSKTRWKGLKSHHVVKLKIQKIKQMSQTYAMFFIIYWTSHVLDNNKYLKGAIKLKRIKLYINRVFTCLYCYRSSQKYNQELFLP